MAKFVSDSLSKLLDDNAHITMGLSAEDANPYNSQKPNLFVIGDLTEYDMSKSNISVAYELGIINESEYNRYLNMPKKERNVKMGLWYRDNPVEKDKVIKGQHEMVDKLIQTNNIPEKNIIFRVFDAIWVYNVFPRVLSFGDKGVVKFDKKTKATSMLYIGKYNAKFFYNSFTDELIVKGITVLADKTTMFSYIKKLISLAESNKTKELYLFFHTNKLTYKNERTFFKESSTFNFACNADNDTDRLEQMSKSEFELFENIALTLIDVNYGSAILK